MKQYIVLPNTEKPSRETDKAVCLFGAWMPKSQVTFTDKYVIIPAWLFHNKNLSYYDNTGTRVAVKVTEDNLQSWL